MFWGLNVCRLLCTGGAGHNPIFGHAFLARVCVYRPLDVVSSDSH